MYAVVYVSLLSCLISPLYSPFLGPFATSRFCLRQAYYTATDRLGGTNLADMVIREEELSVFLKHLFFFHRIYALFDQTFEFDDLLTLNRYIDILEDFNCRDLRKVDLDEKFAALSAEHNGKLTYSVFVKHLAESIFSAAAAFPTDICTALLEKSQDEMKEQEAVARGGSTSLFDPNTDRDRDRDSLLLNVSWYSVADCDDWMQAIESLGNNSFRSILSKSVA
jgi:hypothetical protein